jgi:hypothetical protein
MYRVLVFSYQKTANYSYADINFYNKLKKKIPSDFAAASHKMEKFQSFETYPKIFQKNVKFKKAKTIWINNFFQAAKIFNKYDVLILCGIFGSKIFSDYAKKLGLRVILIDKTFNYDFFVNQSVDLTILRNKYGLQRFRKINKNYKGKIKVASSIDAGEINFPFYKKQKNKNALVVLSGAQHQDIWYDKKIKKIENILIKNNFKIYYKTHPRNKFKSKKIFNNSVNSNNLNSVLKKINIVISIHSNFYQELNYFDYPVIFIDRLLFLSPDYIRNKLKINNFSSKINIYKFLKDKKIVKKIYNFKPKENCERIDMFSSKIDDKIKFYGCDISVDYLDKFLREKEYLNVKIKKIKLEKYKKELLNEVGAKGVQLIVKEVVNSLNNWKKNQKKVKTNTKKKWLLLQLFIKKSLNTLNIF